MPSNTNSNNTSGPVNPAKQLPSISSQAQNNTLGGYYSIVVNTNGNQTTTITMPSSGSSSGTVVTTASGTAIVGNVVQQATQQQQQQNVNNANAATASYLDKQMADLQAVVEELNEKFAQNPDYTIFIEFKMNSVRFCTTEKENSDQNIVMSLEVKNNGSGYANQFTLQVAYAPSVADSWNINALEEQILGFNYNGTDWSSRYCQLRYGYGDSHKELKTKTFNGMVTDYTCDVQDGMLIYTITGYSSITTLNEAKDPISISMSSSEQAAGGMVKPTLAVERIVKTYLQASVTSPEAVDDNGAVISLPHSPISSNVSYDIKFIDDGAEPTRGSDVAVSLTTQLDKNISQAITDILGKAILKADQDVINSGKNLNNLNKTAYGWYIEDNDQTNPGFQGTIYVYKNTPHQIKNSDVSFIFNWMSPGKDGVNFLVHSFQPSFQGKVLLATAEMVLNPKQTTTSNNSTTSSSTNNSGTASGSSSSGTTGSNGTGSNTNSNNATNTSVNSTTTNSSNAGTASGTGASNSSSSSSSSNTQMPQSLSATTMAGIFNASYFLDNTGKLQTTEKSLSPPIGGTSQSAISSIEQEKSSWLNDVQYAYKATLVTVGIPAYIPITGAIKVVPMIYGSVHHSAGVYLIQGTTDSLTPSGFTTTWDLIKLYEGEPAENAILQGPTMSNNPLLQQGNGPINPAGPLNKEENPLYNPQTGFLNPSTSQQNINGGALNTPPAQWPNSFNTGSTNSNSDEEEGGVSFVW